MNALELHLLTAIADAPGSSPPGFEHCHSTLALLQERGLIEARTADERPVFHITERGLAELRRELR